MGYDSEEVTCPPFLGFSAGEEGSQQGAPVSLEGDVVSKQGGLSAHGEGGADTVEGAGPAQGGEGATWGPWLGLFPTWNFGLIVEVWVVRGTMGELREKLPESAHGRCSGNTVLCSQHHERPAPAVHTHTPQGRGTNAGSQEMCQKQEVTGFRV